MGTDINVILEHTRAAEEMAFDWKGEDPSREGNREVALAYTILQEARMWLETAKRLQRA